MKALFYMRIVHLCEFSSGICGTWNAVFETARRQAKKHEVYVLSSNIEKGTGKTVDAREVKDDVKIVRFPLKFSLSSNYLVWDFKSTLEELHPDIIHAHVYRHLYANKAAKIGKQNNIKTVLTTHAPFKRKRGLYLGGLTLLYDLILGKKALKRFNKIIAITNWEKEYLHKLGVEDSKMTYIPNGIPREFFEKSINKENSNTILFLGRLAPIKRIDTLIMAIKDMDVTLKLVGPSEGDYTKHMKWLAKRLDIEDKVKFLGPVTDLKKKISIMSNASVFVLCSESEGMPQALVEAMSLGKLVVGADNEGIKEVINDDRYLFPIGNHKKLKEKLTTITHFTRKVYPMGYKIYKLQWTGENDFKIHMSKRNKNIILYFKYNKRHKLFNVWMK